MTQTTKNRALCIYSSLSRQITGCGRDAGTRNAIKMVSRSRGDFKKQMLDQQLPPSNTQHEGNKRSERSSIRLPKLNLFSERLALSCVCPETALADNTHMFVQPSFTSHTEVISATAL